MQVMILHSLPPIVVASGRRVWEFDLSAATEGIREVVPNAMVAGVRGAVDEILSVLAEHHPDVVFNLCEAPLGRPDLEPHAAALLEWLGIPFTGSRSETLALCRWKDRAHAALLAAGVPVPRSEVFPRIVKPPDEHGSAGLDHDSVCRDEAAVAAAMARWAGPVVIQEFLSGREFAIALWGRTSPDHFFPRSEVSLRNAIVCEAELALPRYAAAMNFDEAKLRGQEPFRSETSERGENREMPIKGANFKKRPLSSRTHRAPLHHSQRLHGRHPKSRLPMRYPEMNFGSCSNCTDGTLTRVEARFTGAPRFSPDPDHPRSSDRLFAGVRANLAATAHLLC
jgi:hypothetical protein